MMPAEQHGDFQNSDTVQGEKQFIVGIIALQRLAVEILELFAHRSHVYWGNA